MKTFSNRDRARQQVERIAQAMQRCADEVTALQRARVERAEKDKVSAGLQYLNDGRVSTNNDTTAQQIAALEAALAGLEIEHAAARTEEDRAFLVDLQEWAATLEPETRALVERGTAIRKELKDITGRLRILHQDSRLVSGWWSKAISRIQHAETGTPSPCTERPLPPKPALGTIPNNLLGD